MLTVTISGSGILGDFYCILFANIQKLSYSLKSQHGPDIEQQNLVIVKSNRI